MMRKWRSKNRQKSTLGRPRVDFNALGGMVELHVGPSVPGIASRARTGKEKHDRERLVEGLTRPGPKAQRFYVKY